MITIDWSALFLGTEDWSFLTEVALRTFIMFLIIIIGLRFMGKRGVKQLSVVELVVIIGLGSAAGDPMFYKRGRTRFHDTRFSHYYCALRGTHLHRGKI